MLSITVVLSGIQHDFIFTNPQTVHNHESKSKTLNADNQVCQKHNKKLLTG